MIKNAMKRRVNEILVKKFCRDTLILDDLMIKHFQRKLRERIVLREKEEKEEGKREIRDCNHKQSE